MAAVVEFRQGLLRMLKARIPFISIKSIERARVLKVLEELAGEIGIPMYVHGLSHGTRDLKTQKVVHDDRSVAGGLDFAVQNIGQRQNLTFVFTEISDIEDDGMLARHLYDCVLQAIERGGSLCVLSNGRGIWPQLQRLGMTLTLDPPGEEEMLTIVRECVDPYRGQIPIAWDEDDFRLAATILANMTLVEAENVLATLMARGALDKADLQELSRTKDRLFSDISGLEKVRADADTLTVAGLDGMRHWLGQQRQLLTADLKARKLRPPRGMLLVGVPGCGKSLSAKFVAASWNLPLYRLDLAAIHGQYLGQSENRLKEALASADNAAPCVLWIDEIEKGLAGATGSSDGGTSTRMVGQFLFWLQESTAKVFVVATANDVSRLPPELLRRGRFDELFFVDLPSEAERADIVDLYVRRNQLPAPTPAMRSQLVALTDGFAGADLESAVREVAVQAIIHGDAVVTDDLYDKSFRNVVPLSRTSPEQIEAIRLWGRERAVPASGQPIAATAGRPAGARRGILI